MHSQTLILGLAGVAAAQLPGHMAVRRQLEARQTDAGALSACAEAIQSVMTGMPTAPAAITEFAMTNTETDPCRVTVPASLSSVYESYGSALASWSSEHAAAYSSALAKCPDFATLTEGSGIDGPTCTNAGNSGNSGNSGSGTRTGSSDSEGTQATGSGSNSGSGSSAGGSSNNNNNNNNNNGANGKKNAAHRETGFAGAAIALAGFLGVVAFL